MMPFIFTDQVAGTVSLIAYVVWMCVEYWLVVREQGQIHDRQDESSKRIIIVACCIALFLCIAIATVVPSASFSGNPWVPVVFGIVCVLLGAWLRVWSVLKLGRFFRTTVMVQGAHRVIQEGPYKYIRHPSYTGFLMSAFGIGMMLGNWLGLIVLFVITFLAFLQRIAVKEAVLARELGEPYQSYMKRTKRLIPFIY